LNEVKEKEGEARYYQVHLASLQPPLAKEKLMVPTQSQVKVLKLDLPESYWPLEFEQLGNSVAVQLYTANQPWLIVLQKKTQSPAGWPAGPVDLTDQQRRMVDAAIHLVKASNRFLAEAVSDPYEQAEGIDRTTSVEKLIRGATLQIGERRDFLGSAGVIAFAGKRYVVTASHVLRRARRDRIPVVSLADDTKGYLEDPLFRNHEVDVAVFDVPVGMEELPAIPLLEREVSSGQPVYLSGYPGRCYHLTNGEVVGYKPRNRRMLHTAPAVGGTSGGMLVTPNGGMCGVNVARSTPMSEDYPHNLATPSTVIAELLKRFG